MADTPILLIHGSCHGAWCWRDVIPALSARGLGAEAIDLPGHGADRTPLDQVTLDGYARAIVSAARRMHDGPVSILGHSMAGYAIAAAAIMAPEVVSRLIFLCAYVPQEGQSLVEMRKAGPRQPLLPAIRPGPDGVSFSFATEFLKPLFYQDCRDADVAFAGARLTPQAIRPQATPLALTDAYHAIEKHYIRCTEDNVIPSEYQAQMARDFAPRYVSTLPSSHSPFFSMPDRLAERLSQIMT
ncbi:MAG: putative hydrolases or acyltransferases (alpha/beta hydrolase superfamily) [Rhodobacteraceae bacterium HLUCCA12]|nr:MAG: putative hydrolases or acyltransferases (alpha/beta hydrolase superfamily) [Rhodobacteraceae bacterium HLUCCA12]